MNIKSELFLPVAGVMENFSLSLRLSTATDEDVLATETDAKIDLAAVCLRGHLLIDLVIDDHGEALILRQLPTVPEEVHQVRHCVQWTGSNADAVWNEFVGIRTPEARRVLGCCRGLFATTLWSVCSLRGSLNLGLPRDTLSLLLFGSERTHRSDLPDLLQT